MEKLFIKQLNKENEVFAERISPRITPAMKQDITRIATETNRNENDVVRIALGWALERIEIVFEDVEKL